MVQAFKQRRDYLAMQVEVWAREVPSIPGKPGFLQCYRLFKS